MKNTTAGASPFRVADRRFVGRVEWFSKRKGYGFIDWQEDKDVFVHRSALSIQGRKILREGQRVEFGVRRTPRGPEAINVIKLPKEVERDTDHPEHNPRVSRERAHHVKSRRKNSDSAPTQAEPFVYSYTIRKM